MASRRRNPKTAVERKVGLYIRISKDRDDQISTDVQKEKGQALIKLHDWTYVTTFEDVGRSAFHVNVRRDEFEQMKVAVEKGVINTIVCYKLDRLYRNTKELLGLLEWLEDHGASIVSMTEPIDTADSGTAKILITLLAALAEMESQQKSERIEDWHAYRRDRGVVPPGPAPYGYTITEDGNGWEVDPDAASKVQNAAEMVLAGASLHATGAAHGWPPRQVKRLLINPHLAGLRVLRDDDGNALSTVEGDWTPILTADAHERLVAKLTDPSRTRVWDNTPRRLLTGIAKCSVCQESLRIKNYPAKNGGSTYACMNAHMSLNADWLEEHITARVLGGFSTLPAAQPGESVAALEAAMREIAAEFAAGQITMEEWRIIRAGLEARHAAAQETAATPDWSDLRRWPHLTIEAKRAFLRRMIVSLEIFPAGGRGKSFYTDEAREDRVKLFLVE